MLHPDAVKVDVLRGVADAIGELVVPQPSPALNTESAITDETSPQPPVSYDMTESFSVWVLDDDDLVYADRTTNLSDLPKATHRWHHQVRENGIVTGYARSVGSVTERLDVRQLVNSNLARNIDAAVAFLDEQEKNDRYFAEADWLVRLLVAPSFQVHAFWLINKDSKESKILLIEAPAYLRKGNRQQLISFELFIGLLQESRPVRGLSEGS
jgi:hypothetical protein